MITLRIYDVLLETYAGPSVIEARDSRLTPYVGYRPHGFTWFLITQVRNLHIMGLMRQRIDLRTVLLFGNPDRYWTATIPVVCAQTVFEAAAYQGEIEHVLPKPFIYLPLPPRNDDVKMYRADQNTLCTECDREYWRHPASWRVRDSDDNPFLHVLCNGDHVKL